jgi:hypothetical protein
MRFGSVDGSQKPAIDRNLAKERLMGVATSTTYTLAILMPCHFKARNNAAFSDKQFLSFNKHWGPAI